MEIKNKENTMKPIAIDERTMKIIDTYILTERTDSEN